MKITNSNVSNNSGGRAPTVEKAADGIRERIFSREYEGGFQLTETVLADEYRISRGSVRSALFMLEKEGLIITLPNGRKVVLGINEKYVNDLYDMRRILECEAAKYCLSQAEIDYTPLARTIAEFYSVGGDPLLQAAANSNFHRALVELAGSRPLILCWETIESSLTAVNKANYAGRSDPMTVQMLVREHTELLDMLMAKEPEAIDALTKHIMSAKTDLKTGIRL